MEFVQILYRCREEKDDSLTHVYLELRVSPVYGAFSFPYDPAPQLRPEQLHDFVVTKFTLYADDTQIKLVCLTIS